MRVCGGVDTGASAGDVESLILLVTAAMTTRNNTIFETYTSLIPWSPNCNLVSVYVIYSLDKLEVLFFTKNCMKIM